MADPDIEELLAAGRKIDAVRLYRERYGGGLKEGKDAIDAIDAEWTGALGTTTPIAPAPDPTDDNSIDALLREGKKINAIKLYRRTHGVGLKEAKEIVDARAAELGIPAGSGCAILGVLAAIGFAFLLLLFRS